MLKMVAGDPPNQVLLIGLSIENLDKFTAQANDTYIRIKQEDTSLPIDVILSSGRPIVVKGTQQHRDIFMIGFSLEQIDHMRQNFGKTLRRYAKADYGLPMDVIIFSGESEAAMAQQFAEFIGPETRVKIDDKLKN